MLSVELTSSHWLCHFPHIKGSFLSPSGFMTLTVASPLHHRLKILDFHKNYTGPIIVLSSQMHRFLLGYEAKIQQARTESSFLPPWLPQTHKFNVLNISLKLFSVYLTRMIAKRFDIWALIVMESAARHRWSLTGAFFKALSGVVSHIGEPSVRVQPRWVHTFQSRACGLKMLGGINRDRYMVTQASTGRAAQGILNLPFFISSDL